MTVLITLTTAGLDAGPFDLYSNVDGYSVPFETGVSRSALLAGYTSTLVPNSTTNVRVSSTGVCTNYIDIPIGGITTTTTSSSTTTTTTQAPFNDVFIDGFATAYGIVQNGVIDTDHETTYSFNLPAGNYEIKFQGTCIPASMGAIPGGFGAQTYSNGYIYFTETNGPTAENNILESNTDATLVGGTFPYNAVYASNTSSINTTNITVPTGGKTYWLRTLVITQIDNLSYSLDLSGVEFYITQL